MSVECSECEWDARAGHDPTCSRSPQREIERLQANLASTQRNLENSLDAYEEVQAEIERLQAFRQQIIEVYGGNYEPEGRLADLSEVIERELARDEQGNV